MAAVEFASTSLFSDANLISYYKLENTSDSKGANNLTNNNTTTFTAGKFNNAATFVRASSQSLTHSPGTDYFSGDADRAFSCWFQLSSQPSNNTFTIFQWGDNVRAIAAWYTDSGGSKTFGLIDGNTMDGRISKTFNNSEYHNIVASYAASGQTWTLYLDGLIFKTSVSNAPAAGNNALDIGNFITTSNFIDGQVDDMAIFSRQLNQTDVNIINGISAHILNGNKYW